LEIADIYVVNKADRDGADNVLRDLRAMLALAGGNAHSWRPPIIKTVANQGEGLERVVEAIGQHRAWMESTGELDRRRSRRARDEIEAIALTSLREKFGNVHGHDRLDELADAVAAGQTDPYAAADEVIAAF
jgi:LAO/AO transport system kinase